MVSERRKLRPLARLVVERRDPTRGDALSALPISNLLAATDAKVSAGFGWSCEIGSRLERIARNKGKVRKRLAESSVGGNYFRLGRSRRDDGAIAPLGYKGSMMDRLATSGRHVRVDAFLVGSHSAPGDSQVSMITEIGRNYPARFERKSRKAD